MLEGLTEGDILEWRGLSGTHRGRVECNQYGELHVVLGNGKTFALKDFSPASVKIVKG